MSFYPRNRSFSYELKILCLVIGLLGAIVVGAFIVGSPAIGGFDMMR